MRKLLLALVLVAAAASITVPRLGDGDDVVLSVPPGADAVEVERAIEARLAGTGLTEVEVDRDGTRVALSPVEGDTRELVEALTASYRLHVRPVEGTCEQAEKPAATDPAVAVELPVRPPSTPSCLRLGPAAASNEAIERAQASGTNVVIHFRDLPLETRREWALEVDGEVLTSPRVAENDEAGIEMVVDALTAPAALALAAGLLHPIPCVEC